MTGPTRCRSQLRVASATPSSVPSSVNSPGSSPGAAGAGGLLRRTEGGRQRPRSRSTGRLPQLTDAPVPRVPDAPQTPSSPLLSVTTAGVFSSGPASASCRGLISSGGRSGEAAEEEEAGGKAAASSSSSSSGASVFCSFRSSWAGPRIFSWCLLLPAARLDAPFALLASLPFLLGRETRRGLRAPYLFSACKPSGLSCVRNLVIPSFMFFILSELYLSGMFLMKRECLPDHMSRGYNPRQRSETFCIVRIDFSLPGNRPCRPPAPLNLSHAQRQGRRRFLAPRFLLRLPRLLSEAGPRNALRGWSLKRAR